MGDAAGTRRAGDPATRGVPGWPPAPADGRHPGADAAAAAQGPELVRAAGAVCWRHDGDGLQVLLVHRPRYQDWSWPKGKLDPGEVPAAAAVREVAEETGARVRLGPVLPTARYRLRPGADKEVSYWAAHVPGELPAPPNPEEVDRTRWATPAEAAALLTRRGDRAQLDAVEQACAEGRLRTWPLLVLRHCKATPRKAWPGPDDERPLAPDGEREAEALVPLLQAWHPDRVLSSPWRRCTDSVQPYADAAAVKLGTRDELSEAGHRKDAGPVTAAVGELVRRGRPVVVCTHRPVLGSLLGSLAGHCSPGVGEQVPSGDPFLAAAEVLVAHVGERGRVVAVERHRPIEA